MEQVSAGQESIPFTESMDGEPVTFCRKCGKVATGRTPSTDSAWFLPGDEPTGSCTHKGKKK
jgi:hypothetical protein